METKVIQKVELPKQKIFEKKEKKTKDVIVSFFRQFLALLIWVYVIAKLFVFDIDIYLTQKFFPSYDWVLNYKFVIIITAIALLLILSRKNFLAWFLYIVFFPAIVLFWKIPYFIFRQKSWALAFAVLNSIISFFRSLKYTFIVFAFYIAASTAILFFHNAFLIWAALFTILIIIIITYIRRFIFIFRPSDIFQFYIKIFSAIRTWGTKTDKGVSFFALEDNIKSITVIEMNDTQLQSWSSKLQMSVLYNRICLFVGKKLREYQNSKLNIVYYVINLLSLIILTIFSFALIYSGLFKINASYFTYPNEPSFFTFIYYSFNSFIFNSIGTLTAVQPISQIVWMIQTFLVFILGVILVALLLSVKNDRHSEELNKVIEEVEKEGKKMETFIQDEYKINSIADALAELQKVQAAFVKFIYKISDDLK